MCTEAQICFDATLRLLRSNQPRLRRSFAMSFAVAWDEASQSHVYRRDVDLTIEGGTIAAIGPAAPEGLDDAAEIDGHGFAIGSTCSARAASLPMPRRCTSLAAGTRRTGHQMRYALDEQAGRNGSTLRSDSSIARASFIWAGS